MILLVSQHRMGDVYANSNGHHEIKVRLEKIARTPVLVQHYSEVSPALVTSLPVDAIFIAGTAVPFTEVEPEHMQGLYELVRTTDVPIIGVCGGHQLLGVLFSHNPLDLHNPVVDLIRPLGEGEYDSMAEKCPGYLKELGMWPVEITVSDPLFEGLGKMPRFFEWHSREIKQLPEGFVRLARNVNCDIQAMKHRDKCIYGVQFHPENWTEPYPAGKRLLENFFRIAGLIE